VEGAAGGTKRVPVHNVTILQWGMMYIRIMLRYCSAGRCDGDLPVPRHAIDAGAGSLKYALVVHVDVVTRMHVRVVA